MKKAGYKFLEHSADIMVLAWGKNFLSALKQIFYAYRTILISKTNFKKIEKNKFVIKEKAYTKPELIFNFFSSVIAKSEIKQVVPIDIKFEKLESKKNKIMLKAIVFWDKNIKPKDSIKAITYHQLDVKESKSCIKIKVIFDV